MSPPGGVVYDNVVRAGDSDDYSLFGGVKFFVHQRVPTRSDIINAITSNGGLVVKLEKLADVIIADHARKDAPANSVSWKYIDESVKRGELVDIARHRIGGPAGPARSTVGTSAPTKQTRTPFTSEEDSMLIKWVRTQEYPDGNKCYQEFADRHPRHTWQSYKDRYKKYLIDKPDEGAAAAPSSRPAPLHQQRPAPQPQPTTPAAVSNPLRKGKRFFTAEEDKILRDYVLRRVNEGEGPSGFRIYHELEAMYPHRTFNSWRDRWVRHLSMRPFDEETNGSGQTAVIEPRRVSQPPQSLRASQESRHSRVAESSRVSSLSRTSQLSREPQPSLGPHHRDHRSPKQSTHSEKSASIDRMAQIDKNSKKALQNLLEQGAIFVDGVLSWPDSELEIKEEPLDLDVGIPSQLPVQDDMVAEPWIEEPALQHEAEMQVEAGIRPSAGVEMTNHESHQTLSPTSSAPPRSAKEQFYDEIQEYYEYSGLPLKKWLTVGDKTLELWDLWKAVTDQDKESGYRDWEQIAETLNFDWITNPNITNQLQCAFDEHLQGYEEALKSFEEEMEEEEMDDEEEAEEGGSQQGPAQTPEFLQSSPPVPSQKRRQEHSPILGFSPNKRLRYNPDHEIPETPEKPEHAGQTSPRTGRTVRPADPMSLRTKRQHELAQTASTKPIPEPETQDFTFQHPGHEGAEPDLLDIDSLSDDSAGSEFPSLKELKFENQRNQRSRSDSSSDAFGTPMKSPPTLPARTASAAYPTLSQPKPTRPTTPKPAPRPLLTGRRAPTIYTPPPRRASSGVARPTGPPVPQPKPSPLQPPRQATTRRFFNNSSPPQPKHSPEPVPKTLAGLSQAEREYYIHDYVNAGYERADVVTALRATNDVVDNAELVMMVLRMGQGIPGNFRGVWTQKDDDDLLFVMEIDQLGLGQGSRVRREADEKLKRLVEKHRAGSVEERRKYLAPAV